mmetsp:Transcript_21032/g.57962  ORF Transcript_21032/g.57962 Transcript_21032/m.57962 type:complete len:219 (+) Transcript_21032:1917-2573(+)
MVALNLLKRQNVRFVRKNLSNEIALTIIPCEHPRLSVRVHLRGSVDVGKAVVRKHLENHFRPRVEAPRGTWDLNTATGRGRRRRDQHFGCLNHHGFPHHLIRWTERGDLQLEDATDVLAPRHIDSTVANLLPYIHEVPRGILSSRSRHLAIAPVPYMKWPGLEELVCAGEIGLVMRILLTVDEERDIRKDTLHRCSSSCHDAGSGPIVSVSTCGVFTA